MQKIFKEIKLTQDMKKMTLFYLVFTILLFSLPFIQAQNNTLIIEKVAIYDVVTMEEVNIPAEYNVTIKNPNNYDDFFKIYTLLEASLGPASTQSVPAGLETTFTVILLPYDILKERCGEGTCKVQYYLKADRTGVIEDSFTIKILSLEKIISADVPTSIARDDSVLVFDVKNKENINLGEIQFTFESEFSTTEQTFSLEPKSSQKIELELDTGKLKTSKAGDYEAELKFLINDEYEHVVKKIITLEEITSIKTDESSKFTFFGFTKTITKKNEGNSPKFVTIEIIKNKFEHGFTSSSIPPTSEEPSGAIVSMKWQRELEPGESFSVEIHTDYTIPIIILILIIIVAVGIYLVKRPRLIVKKKAFKIQTKGGEFAIKLVLLVKNIGQQITNVKCTDRLPHMLKIYERFGASKPDKIEKNTLFWKFGDLMPGEERVVSYIIYSKVVPVGTITIPKAVVSYINKKDMRKVVSSNSLLVMGEPEE
ncbi:MAG: hypothetical protein IB618_02120 [Candidatus Pacearchaeota archaeon]|nr:MAG: hypothetical protein IB618_02120 [Candidatus Pacearchaeota archaeon]